MDDDRPSSSGINNPEPAIDQDKIVFAFEREYFSTYGKNEPQRSKGSKATALFNPFQNGLQLRDQELVDFLNERLGDHEETWAGKNVAAFLSREMIEELETCFQGLEPIAKLKIVLGFSQLSTKRLHDWRKEINTLLEIAAQDPDDWVEAISDNLRIFSPTGIIELEPTRNMEMYREALGRVYHKLLEFANKEDSEFCHVPDVYHFCDEKVIEAELNYTPREPEVHFTVKKKLKADILREELLSELKDPKPVDDKNQGIVSSLPMKYRSTLRKPDLKTPMRGIIQPNATKINGGFTSEPKKFPRQLAKRDGGSLLISIDDIPHAHLKRKKEQDKEERDRKREQEQAEKKRLDAERRKALVEKAEQKRKEAERMREEAMKRKKEAEAARLAKPEPPPPPKPAPPVPCDQALAFTDPSLELERLRQRNPCMKMEVDMKEERDEPMDTNESDKAVEWMFHHDEVSQSKIGDNKEDDYEFLNRPRPAGLESRETIIQKTTTELIDTVTCCTLEHQRQIIAFMSGNRLTYRPLLGSTNIVKISDSIQQGITDDGVCRVRVESFIHLNFDSGEWRKQQKCKVLGDEETPRDFDGRHCPRLTHQQIFNEIARNLTDEPEDKKFAGESVIVQAYVPAKPNIEVHLSEDNNKLLSPTGSANNEVLYGQEVTAGEMMTVQTGISGCTGMRTVVGKSNLLSPVLIAAVQSAPTVAVAAPSPIAPQPVPTTPVKKNQKAAPRMAQQQQQQQQQHLQMQQQIQPQMQQSQQSQSMQPTYIQMSIDSSQLQQIQQHFSGQLPPTFVLQQSPQQQQPRMVSQQQQHHQQQQQQQQQQQMMGMQRQTIPIPQFVQQSVSQSMHMQRPNPPNQSNQAYFSNNQPLPNGTQMFVMGGNMPNNFNLVPHGQNPNAPVQQQQSYQMNPPNQLNQLQNVSTYQFQTMPDDQQQYRY